MTSSVPAGSTLYQGIPAALLLGGLYFPTSIDGNILKSLMMLSYLLIFILLMRIAWLSGLDEDRLLFISLPIVLVLCLCTLLSRVYIMGFGTLGGYAVIALLYGLQLKGLRLGMANRRLFLACNVTNLLIAAAIVFRWDAVNQLILSAYANFYDELVPNMLSLGEPVLTLATHSLAGCLLFLFFWL